MDTQEEKDPYFGIVGEGAVETDYQLGGSLELPKPRMTFYDKKIQYHQPDVAPNCCTVHGAMGAVSDLTGHEFSLAERKAIWDRALRLGADPAVGWTIREAVDLVRKMGSEFTGQELMSFLAPIGSDEFFKVLDQGYTVTFGFRGNAKYNSDTTADGILDGDSFGTTTYGHMLRMVKTDKPDEYEIIVDNYSKRKEKPNTYKVRRANIEKLLANRVFFRSAYVFALKEDVDQAELAQRVPVWALASWTKAVKKRIIEGDEDPNTSVGTETTESILVKLKALSKQEGWLSLARYVVALDRMGELD